MGNVEWVEFYSKFDKRNSESNSKTLVNKFKKRCFQILPFLAIDNVVKNESLGFPGGSVVKNPPANAGDTGSSLDPGRSHMLRSN